MYWYIGSLGCDLMQGLDLVLDGVASDVCGAILICTGGSNSTFGDSCSNSQSSVSTSSQRWESRPRRSGNDKPLDDRCKLHSASIRSSRASSLPFPAYLPVSMPYLTMLSINACSTSTKRCFCTRSRIFSEARLSIS